MSHRNCSWGFALNLCSLCLYLCVPIKLKINLCEEIAVFSAYTRLNCFCVGWTLAVAPVGVTPPQWRGSTWIKWMFFSDQWRLQEWAAGEWKAEGTVEAVGGGGAVHVYVCVCHSLLICVHECVHVLTCVSACLSAGVYKYCTYLSVVVWDSVYGCVHWFVNACVRSGRVGVWVGLLSLSLKFTNREGNYWRGVKIEFK